MWWAADKSHLFLLYQMVILMAESDTHKRLKIVACAFLKKICIDVVSVETKFNNIRSIADVCGLNFRRKEVRIVEVKATLADYKRDSKLFKLEKSYFPHCNYFYIMCPTGVIPKDMVLKEFGLIYVDDKGNADIIQKPQKNKKLKTRFETTLKNTCRSITNHLIFKVFKVTSFTNLIKDKSERKKK